MVRRTRSLSPRSTAVTSPIWLMMPVNNDASIQWPRYLFESVIAHAFRGKTPERRRARQRGQRQAIESIDSVGSDRGPGPKERRFVNEIGAHERGGKNGPGLNQEPGYAAFGQHPQHRREIKPAAQLSHALHVDAPHPERLLALGSCALPCDDPKRHSLRARDQPAPQREPEPTIEDDAHRRMHTRQAARQKRIVRKHRANAGQHGVIHCAHQVNTVAAGPASKHCGATAGKRDLAVGRECNLQRYMRPTFLHAPDMTGMSASCRLRSDTYFDVDSALGQPPMPRSGD